MNRLTVKFINCYGIKKLEKEFNFRNRTFSVYAPNGVMKSSFAKTFNDFSDNKKAKDLHFPERETTQEITTDTDIAPENVFVIKPYDQDYESDKMSTLVANKQLKNKYEDIHKEIDKAQVEFTKRIKELCGIGRYEEIIYQIESTFQKSFFDVLIEIEGNVLTAKDNSLSKIDYSVIFNSTVINFLKTKDFKDAIKSYIEKYYELIDKSVYLKKEFSFYQAENVQKQLASNNFFKAGHSVNMLNEKAKEEYSTDKDFKELLESEKKKVLENEDLRKKFDEINNKLTNANLRNFRDYLLENKEILPELSDIDAFKRKVWVAYMNREKDLYKELIKKYRNGQGKIKELIELAKKEQTSWEEVVDIFNSRFTYLPFYLSIRNKEDVILEDEVPTITFIIKDGEDVKEYEDKNELMDILSTGEKKALYILNVIFEVEARKKSSNEVLFIIDDIADSFDYKNKYAIVEYLKYMSEIDTFYMFILTHNFDFFRTIQSRGISPYSQCLIALKNDEGITLERAEYLKNPFINDWKNHLDDNKKLIASVPFIRNIIEYTEDIEAGDYLLLTAMLHYKNNSDSLTLSDLKGVFERIIQNLTFPNGNLSKGIIELIYETAEECLSAPEGINLENKIVLSIAIRLKAEQFMKSKITDTTFLSDIDNSKNQTWSLIKKYQEEFNNDKENIKILKRVNLMTPENIHVNSFMYEPIIDIGDNELRELYISVKNMDH